MNRSNVKRSKGLIWKNLFWVSLSMVVLNGGIIAHAQSLNTQINNQGIAMGSNSSAGPENIMIILDDSASMSEPIAPIGESKLTVAKRNVIQLLQRLSPETRVGLRVYGNSATPFLACHATTLLVPLGQNNHNLIASKLIGLRPTGMTPISYTVTRSLTEDFVGFGGKRSIILISDGMETCGEDPCKVAVRMQQSGIDVKIDVVGLGLNDYQATRQLRCVALGTKGQFFSANSAGELANSLNRATAVETAVQGTIMPDHPAYGSNNRRPPSPQYRNSSPNPSASASPSPASLPPHADDLLPAAVPIK